jgi:selenium metabolism protein YedF
MKTVFVIGGESLGAGSTELGAKLMGSFLRTLSAMEPKPEALLFYNASVKLLRKGSGALEALKALEDQGVELLACVTCLEFFGLLEDLAVGRVSNMREIVGHMLEAQKVITV